MHGALSIRWITMPTVVGLTDKNLHYDQSLCAVPLLPWDISANSKAWQAGYLLINPTTERNVDRLLFIKLFNVPFIEYKQW